MTYVFVQWIMVSALILGIISLIHSIVKRNYFEVESSRLIIHEGLLDKKIIELDKIERFKIEPGPFNASKIILKDQSTISYSDSQTDDKNLKEFMAQFNIPVG